MNALVKIISGHWRFLVFSWLVLFLSFAFDLFGAVPVPSFVGNFKDSEALVTNHIVCKGDLYAGQLLERKHFDGGNVAPACDVELLKPYSSQFGLQARAYGLGYAALTSIVAMRVDIYVGFMQLLTALVSALCFALLALWVRRRFGRWPAVSFVLLVAISPMLVSFARNLYWALPLMVLPLVFALFGYDRLVRRSAGNWRRQVLFWSGLGVLLYLRYLCGYEYLTTLTIMVAAVVIYYLYLADGLQRVKRYAGQLTLVLVVSVLAFGAALGTHVLALRAPAGSASAAIKVIRARAAERTADSEKYLIYAYQGLRANSPDAYAITNNYLNLERRTEEPTQLGATGVSFLNYSMLPVIGLPIVLSQPFGLYVQSLAAFVLLLALLFVRRRQWLKQADIRQVEALFLAAAIGFVGYLSWMVLARPHSLAHAHINGVLLYLPFALFGFIIIGLYVRQWTASVAKKLRR